jgi:hypothetical protein
MSWRRRLNGLFFVTRAEQTVTLKFLSMPSSIKVGLNQGCGKGKRLG